MYVKDAYLYTGLNRKTRYFFISEGENKRIVKTVVFSPLGNRLWNLGFGDLQYSGYIDDSVVSNNDDLIKVISTVAKIAYEFSDKYPLRRIQIKPVDEKRKGLYNHVFRRHYDTIDANFDIIGINEQERETYSPKKNYDIFELNRKIKK